MSYPINYPTPQGANIQIFTTANPVTGSFSTRRLSWYKPQGVSFVWFTLIGAGGGGGNATSDGVAGSTARGGGGGSGVVTNCLVPAFLIPDQLLISVGQRGDSANAGDDTFVYYSLKTPSAPYELLQASGGGAGGSASATGGVANDGAGGTGGVLGTAGSFAAAGFYQSVNGQDGTDGNVNQSTSTTTFLQGGVGGNGTAAAGQYGYTKSNLNIDGFAGYGFMQPIIASLGSNDAGTSFTSNALALAGASGFGSGGGGASITTATTRYGNPGGNGLVVIISW